MVARKAQARRSVGEPSRQQSGATMATDGPTPPTDVAKGGRAVKRRRCVATTSAGTRCSKAAVPGLTVCKTHGGGTSASQRKSRLAKAIQVTKKLDGLWAVPTDDASVDIVTELRRLADSKRRDILALRIELGIDPSEHIGMLDDTEVEEEFSIDGTVQSKYGGQSKRTKRAGVSPLVSELHKAEVELTQILRTLNEVDPVGTDAGDVARAAAQAARAAARLVKAYPGISVDDVALEVMKNAG